MKTEINDYGCDPLGNGMFRMVPSGDIVTATEKENRLKSRREKAAQADCLGLTWQQIEHMQGGKLKY